MSDIKWQEPPTPASGPGGGRWRGFAVDPLLDDGVLPIMAALQERPGEWALIDEGATHRMTASNIKREVLREKRDDFELTSRKRGDGKIDTYARYVGGESA